MLLQETLLRAINSIFITKKVTIVIVFLELDYCGLYSLMRCDTLGEPKRAY